VERLLELCDGDGVLPAPEPAGLVVLEPANRRRDDALDEGAVRLQPFLAAAERAALPDDLEADAGRQASVRFAGDRRVVTLSDLLLHRRHYGRSGSSKGVEII